MVDIIDFTASKQKQRKQQRKSTQSAARKKLRCQNGHHKWQLKTSQQFDVKQGRLVTVYECAYCKKIKTTLL